MKKGSQTFLAGRWGSIRCALKGVLVTVLSQHNAWLHLVATLLVIGAGFLLRVDRFEWCWLVAAMASVWAAEAMNTALEFLTDLASPEYHPLAGKAKDAAAGAVLITAVGAAIIGVLILGPHLLARVR